MGISLSKSVLDPNTAYPLLLSRLKTIVRKTIKTLGWMKFVIFAATALQPTSFKHLVNICNFIFIIYLF